jgi:uncharacterized protein YbaA (DUF1428 family)
MKMAYVDGFVLPVPKKNMQAYRRMASKAGKIWREHGALLYIDAVADDVKPGKWTLFPQSVPQATPTAVGNSSSLRTGEFHRCAL